MADVATLVDLVIGFTLIEGAALAWLHRRRGEGVAPRRFLPSMAAGLCLMLALRSHVHEAGATAVALCLLGAGAAHAVDLALRWRRRAGTGKASA